jgi:hypothetical protein
MTATDALLLILVGLLVGLLLYVFVAASPAGMWPG